MKWQYQFIMVTNPPRPRDVQDTLNTWGTEGWELVTITENFLSEGHTMVLKRPIQDSN